MWFAYWWFYKRLAEVNSLRPMMHICVGNLTIITSDIGPPPGWHQEIIYTNVGILLIGPIGTDCSEHLIEIHIFLFKKMHLKDRVQNDSHVVSASMCWRINVGWQALNCMFNNMCCCLQDIHYILTRGSHGNIDTPMIASTLPSVDRIISISHTWKLIATRLDMQKAKRKDTCNLFLSQERHCSYGLPLLFYFETLNMAA